MMKYRKPILIAFLVLGAALLVLSFTVIDGKKPKLKNTKWQGVEEMFVADAGTMTITHTLAFTSDKDVIVTHESYMPSYPAMYMNADGSVDMIPARSSSSSDTCTYKVKGKKVVITDKEGDETVYVVKGNNVFSLVTSNPLTNEELVFTQLK